MYVGVILYDASVSYVYRKFWESINLYHKTGTERHIKICTHTRTHARFLSHAHMSTNTLTKAHTNTQTLECKDASKRRPPPYLAFIQMICYSVSDCRCFLNKMFEINIMMEREMGWSWYQACSWCIQVLGVLFILFVNGVITVWQCVC